MVREALFRHLEGFDPSDGSVDIRCLRALGHIRKVVIKPNWVCSDTQNTQAVTTNASLIRPIIDYLLLAFGEECSITIGDVPLQSCNLDEVWLQTGVSSLKDYYQPLKLNVNFVDLRRERSHIDSQGFVFRREPLQGDKNGYISVHLRNQSFLEEICGANPIFSVNDYEPGTTNCYHLRGQHSYFVPASILDCDLFVNLPKLKTHCKAGLTVSMKNLIGINADKAWIPHFRVGAPINGGDEYPNDMSFIQNLKAGIRRNLQGRSRILYHLGASLWKVFKNQAETKWKHRLLGGGAWAGNDTIWRSILDLVTVITFADRYGKMHSTPQRAQICIVDGIVSGEGNGPLTPSPKSAGAVICSSDPVSSDWVACELAGFNFQMIPLMRHASRLHQFSETIFPSSPEALRLSGIWPHGIGNIRNVPNLRFSPPDGWEGVSK